MDLVAEMLLLNPRTSDDIRRGDRSASSDDAALHSAAARRRTAMWTVQTASQPRLGLSALAASQGRDFDLFHIVDHSYAHLATHLPAGRALISCHDLDAFRGVLPGSHGVRSSNGHSAGDSSTG